MLVRKLGIQAPEKSGPPRPEREKSQSHAPADRDEVQPSVRPYLQIDHRPRVWRRHDGRKANPCRFIANDVCRRRKQDHERGLAFQRLGGTDDATKPFWSPDSGSIGFVAGSKRPDAPLTHGAVAALAAGMAEVVPALAEEMIALASRREALGPQVAVWMPPLAALETCRDKWRFACAMRDAGFVYDGIGRPNGVV